jgi:hypothetical protein
MAIASNWIDLSKNKSISYINTEVCVIGAGAAGIYIATQLAELNIEVTLIEAGGLASITTEEIGFNPIFKYEKYLGATKGRNFGLGGSTSKWGGALVPHNQVDVLNKSKDFEIWFSVIKKINDNIDIVLNRLGYRKKNNFDEYASLKIPHQSSLLNNQGIKLHSNLYLPFSKKNFRNLLFDRRLDKLRVIYNAVVSDWGLNHSVNDELQYSYVIARSETKSEVKVYSKRFIIAAGAIESTRILLEMNSKNGLKVFNHNDSIGAYLSDHLSLPIAEVSVYDRKKIVELFSPYFEGNWMRGIRFLELNDKSNTPRYFTHFIFDNQSVGFKLAREILSSIQARKFPNLKFSTFLKSITDLFQLGFYKFIYSRLFIDKLTPSHLQLDIEQLGKIENKIILTKDKDKFERYKICIDWKVSREDIDNIISTAARFISKWNNTNSSLPRLNPINLHKDYVKPYDAYHPVGTCKIGEQKDSVVDYDLKVWGTSNVWVVSTAVLPSAGTANPTLTTLCLAQDLVFRISRNIEN